MYKNGVRSMAWVAKIDRVEKHPNADTLDICSVGGWKCVTKMDEFEEGHLAIYISIDSWIPHELAPFLSKGSEPREYNGVKGERLRTIKLRGTLSQGLLLPLTVLNPRMHELEEHLVNAEGFDCTELLGIQKWEAPIPAQLAGDVRGNFPSMVPKTDQERVQNLTKELDNWRDLQFEVTEKLDGSSCTMFLDMWGDFHVCSRNLDLKYSVTNSFWRVALEYGVESILRNSHRTSTAIQGELIGPGIQKNPYGLKDVDFYVFDVYDSQVGSYLNAEERQKFCETYGLKHVPVFPYAVGIEEGYMTVEHLLSLAEGKSVLNPKTEREGLVFKCLSDPNIHFKAISNKFLMKEKS